MLQYSDKAKFQQQGRAQSGDIKSRGLERSRVSWQSKGSVCTGKQDKRNSDPAK